MGFKYFLCATVFALSIHITHNANVVIVPLDGEGSHYRSVKSIAEELLNRGHNVTFLIDDRFEEIIKSSKDYQLFKYEIFPSNFTLNEWRDLLVSLTEAGLKGEYLQWIMDILSTNYTDRQVIDCDNLLGNVELIKRLKTYDLAVVDMTLNCPIMQYVGIPFVVFQPGAIIAFGISLTNRFPFNLAYMPEFATALDEVMTLPEKLKNTVIASFFSFVLAAFANPYDGLKAKYGLADISLYYTDAEMWFLATDFALDFPRPFLPNTVPVGGLTTKPARTLDRDWEDFLQSAGDDGVVLFSMGSYATGIDEDIAALFAGAFAQLPQKVIWKLNGKPSSTLTANVKVVDWIPQNDLLAHPQIKVFVYHCGLNGIWEAVYHGVPMVAIPLFGDQFDNAQRLVSRGMGVKVDIATLTSDELAEAIRTVINNPSYKDNATRISSIFRDRSRTPAEEAADWLEYVIRHGGAKHLRSAALDLNIFQYFLLDVMAVLLVAFLTVFAILICCCRLCFRGCRKVCGRTTKAKSE
ncbi:UDP-glucuronosyltransferase 2A2-like isoform X4 [Amphiura filiformis]|uniref:UDP-glucuronosyltransferase 2A2-like isoform X4 n=1 Tax=Amphiura filiformis TaxID=82378 RepID=UPI003B221FCF